MESRVVMANPTALRIALDASLFHGSMFLKHKCERLRCAPFPSATPALASLARCAVKLEQGHSVFDKGYEIGATDVYLALKIGSRDPTQREIGGDRS